MALSPETRSSLIARLPNLGDQDAWREFVELYEPFIYRQARRFGLQDADASEAVQDVLIAVSSAVRRFEVDSHRGKFRTWLYAIGRNICLQRLAKLRTCEKAASQALIGELAETPERESKTLRDALRRRVFLWVAGQVRTEFEANTWQAFWATAVENHAIQQTAKQLGMSVGSVYIARSRVMARLRSRVQELTMDELPDVVHQDTEVLAAGAVARPETALVEGAPS